MSIRVRTDVIRTLREERSWTQEDLAEAARLSARTVQRMERDGVISVRTLKATAAAFDVATHALEFRTDQIDFSPVIMEIKILMLAITRRIMPFDDRELPNSLVALFAAVSFSASFTLINAIVTIASQRGDHAGNFQSLTIFVFALAFCGFFAAIVYPLFKLKNWARISMLAISGCFILINTGLLVTGLFAGSGSLPWADTVEYLFNLAVAGWMIWILTRADIVQLYANQQS